MVKRKVIKPIKPSKTAKSEVNDVDEEFEDLLKDLGSSFYTAEDDLKEEAIQWIESLIRKLKYQIRENLDEDHPDKSLELDLDEEEESY